MLENYEQKLKSGYYYVRTAWEDTDTQIGQYRLLTSAVKKVDENSGYSVFTPDGISIYPAEDTAGTDTQAAVASEGASEEEAQVNTQAEDENAAEGVVRVSEQDEIEDEPTTADEYSNNGNTEPVLYARANTLLNIRAGNSLDADKIGEIRKGTIVEVLEVCDNGWYRIKSDSTAYVSNSNGKYFNTGTSLYTVQPADSLWKIAEKTLGDGKRYTDIKAVNSLTSNVIRVGMVLLIP